MRRRIRIRCTARSIASPTARSAATSARPVLTATDHPGSAARSASAHPAARAAWSVARPGPCAATAIAPSASVTRRPPCASTTPRAARTAQTGSEPTSVVIAGSGRSSRGASAMTMHAILCSPRPSPTSAFGVDRAVTSISERARATATPLEGRNAGSLDSMRATRSSSAGGTVRPRSRRHGTSSNAILIRIAITLSPSKAGLPVRHSWRMQPSAKTSARASRTRALPACSGAMYAGVPTTVPLRVARIDVGSLARPKSTILACSSAPPARSTLPGLRSRWITPRAWSAPSASARREPSATVSAMDSGERRMRLTRSSPSIHSMARYCRPSPVSPCATYRTIPG